MRTLRTQWLILALGLAVGVAVTSLWHSSGVDTSQDDYAEQMMREQMIHAVGSATGESFALATGQIDEDAEGIFALDFVTGDLNVRVLNKKVGKFLGAFKRNVLADLRVEGDKAPKFVMVTGNAAFSSSSSAMRPSFCVLYVGDVNTGRVVAYSVPWNRTLAASARAQTGSLVVVDGFEARGAVIQE